MATATKSAATAVTQLFGTITTTANVITTAVTAVGNTFDVLNVRSTDWLQETREAVELNSIDRSARLRDETAHSMATRLVERSKLMGTNVIGYDKAYDASMQTIEAHYAAKAA